MVKTHSDSKALTVLALAAPEISFFFVPTGPGARATLLFLVRAALAIWAIWLAGSELKSAQQPIKQYDWQTRQIVVRRDFRRLLYAALPLLTVLTISFILVFGWVLPSAYPLKVTVGSVARNHDPFTRGGKHLLEQPGAPPATLIQLPLKDKVPMVIASPRLPNCHSQFRALLARACLFRHIF